MGLTMGGRPAMTARHPKGTQAKRSTESTTGRIAEAVEVGKQGRKLKAPLEKRAAPAKNNARLSTDLRKREGELRQAQEQQSAMSAVLKLVSNSTGKLEPIFKSILEKSTRICNAEYASLYLRDGQGFRAAAFHNPPPGFVDARGES